MLDSTPAGRESVASFAEEYMRLDRIVTQAKDPSLFPAYGPNLQAAMVRDVRDTWASLAFDDQTSAMNLFTSTKELYEFAHSSAGAPGPVFAYSADRPKGAKKVEA